MSADRVATIEATTDAKILEAGAELAGMIEATMHTDNMQGLAADLRRASADVLRTFFIELAAR